MYVHCDVRITGKYCVLSYRICVSIQIAICDACIKHLSLRLIVPSPHRVTHYLRSPFPTADAVAVAPIVAAGAVRFDRFSAH